MYICYGVTRIQHLRLLVNPDWVNPDWVNQKYNRLRPKGSFGAKASPYVYITRVKL